jgi:hypothetical protein
MSEILLHFRVSGPLRTLWKLDPCSGTENPRTHDSEDSSKLVAVCVVQARGREAWRGVKLRQGVRCTNKGGHCSVLVGLTLERLQ